MNSENFIPPGTIKINDSLFIDKTPISNLSYADFEKSISMGWNLQTKDSIKKMPNYGIDLKNLKELPGTNVDYTFYNSIKRNRIDTINDKVINYSYHPKYSSNPVLNISKENAELFCLWRTDMVDLAIASKLKTINKRNDFPNKVTYRLPTNQELMVAEAYFKNKKLLKVSNLDLPINMIFDSVKEKFYLVNLYETNSNEVKDKRTKPSIFRCICEISN